MNIKTLPKYSTTRLDDACQNTFNASSCQDTANKKNNHSDISNKMDKAIKNDKAIKQMHMLLAIHSFVVNQIFWIITWNLPKNKQGAEKEG